MPNLVQNDGTETVTQIMTCHNKSMEKNISEHIEPFSRLDATQATQKSKKKRRKEEKKLPGLMSIAYC